jgi:hypothetical protein
MPVTPELGRQRQEGHEFNVSLGYILRHLENMFYISIIVTQSKNPSRCKKKKRKSVMVHRKSLQKTIKS